MTDNPKQSNGVSRRTLLKAGTVGAGVLALSGAATASDNEIPHIAEKLFETYPERAREAIENGYLALRTRDELPYGLAIFDERVGIGGYDETTGLMHVFVDTDAPIAREWAERVYASVREDSEPLEERADPIH